MTWENKKNHYNVKLLRGYGVSISLKNSKIILKNGAHDVTGKSEKEEWFANNMPYEKIVVSGKGYISTEAMSVLSEHNRHVILVDTYGNPVTFCEPVRSSMVATKYRMGQYDTFRDKSKCEYLSKQIILAKKESQLNLLELIGSDVRFLPEKESSASKIYFVEFAKFIPKKYRFTSRNQSFIRTSKNNATDVINALLNYGYSVLAGQILKYVLGVGLDPYLGFMHRPHTGFHPLVYDLIEPFRWLVDYSVFQIANRKDSRRRIKQKDFVYTREGRVVLDSELIRKFLEMLERTFQKERRYNYKFGLKIKDGLKSVQEITIAKISVLNIAEFCLEKQIVFKI